MLRFVEVFMIYFSCYFGTSFSSGISNRIVRGYTVNITDFPYMLALEELEYRKYVTRCGASVLNKQWALTAAHCVYKMPKENIRLRGASSLRLSGGTIYEVGSYVYHPSYNSTSQDYDIGVIKVARNFEYSQKLQPIKLAHTAPPVGSPCTASGWGRTSLGGPFPVQLQAVVLRIIDEVTCQRFYHNILGLTPRNLCAGITEETKGICGGDSGGPLVANGKQIGISSWTEFCGAQPGVFISVPVLRQWITSITGVN